MVDNYSRMYSKTPAYILGFRGCHQNVYNEVIFNNQLMPKSTNQYGWLGNGIYFWENSYQRAVEWAYSHYGDEFDLYIELLKYESNIFYQTE